MKISVIVPVYNVEKYLPSCLKSLLHQGMGPEEYEIICIDDGSTDESGKIAASYAERFPQIKLFKQENKGVSSARNAGIVRACGDYLCFADPDDYLMENVLGQLYDIAVLYQLEKLLFDYAQIEEWEQFRVGENRRRQPWTREDFLFFEDGIKMDESGAVPEWKVAWNYLVKRSVITTHHLLFNEQVKFIEDQDFNFWLNHCVGKCGYLNEKIYFYRMRQGSLMHTFMDDACFETYIRGRLGLAVLYRKKLEAFYQGNPSMFPVHITGEVLEDRMLYEIQGVFSRLLRKGDKKIFEDILQEAGEKGVYPYKMRLRRLNFHQKKKQVLINWLTFLYPWEWYLRFCMAIRCFRQKRG